MQLLRNLVTVGRGPLQLMARHKSRMRTPYSVLWSLIRGSHPNQGAELYSVHTLTTDIRQGLLVQPGRGSAGGEEIVGVQPGGCSLAAGLGRVSVRSTP